MSVETIVARIAAEAETEAEALLAAADATARSLVEAAVAGSTARVATALDRIEPALQAEEAKTVNAARLRLLERRAERSSRRASAVFEIAGPRLEEIEAHDRDRWAEALRRLVEECLATSGIGAVVRVRRSDARLLGSVVDAWGLRVEATDDGTAGPGPVVLSADGRVEIDATITARLATARTRLAEPVARLLGLEG